LPAKKARKRFDAGAHRAREEFRVRFEAEKLNVQRQYCTRFGFWIDCQRKRCHKLRACTGNALVCLLRSIDRVPRDVQFAAREKLLVETPTNLPAPERAAREIFPSGFADGASSFRPQDIPAGWTRRAERGGRTAKVRGKS
jgi:hypothetical protein